MHLESRPLVGPDTLLDGSELRLLRFGECWRIYYLCLSADNLVSTSDTRVIWCARIARPGDGPSDCACLSSRPGVGFLSKVGAIQVHLSVANVGESVDGLTYVGNAEVHLNSTNFAEKADPWATAETSAVGRAIAWSGYAGTPDNPSIASADEVIRAQAKVVDAPAFTEAEQAQLATIKQGIRTDQWTAFKVHVWGKRVEDDELTPGMLPRLQSAFDKLQKGGANGK